MDALTCTWRGDAEFFGLQREVIRYFGDAGLRHHVVVQSEDAEYFEAYASDPGVVLHTTSELLPGALDELRIAHAHRMKRLGRYRKVMRSVHKRTGIWPWLRYDGWHMQQVSKLAFAAQSDAPYLLVLDSDTFPVARLAPVSGEDGAVMCWSSLAPAPAAYREKRWQVDALRLLGVEGSEGGMLDFYTEPPFILVPEVVRGLLDWLETRYQRPWFDVLLERPSGDWSEFAIYSAYLRFHYRGRPVRFVDQQRRCVVRESDWQGGWKAQVARAFSDPEIDWLVVHSAQRKHGKQDIPLLEAHVRSQMRSHRGAENGSAQTEASSVAG